MHFFLLGKKKKASMLRGITEVGEPGLHHPQKLGGASPRISGVQRFSNGWHSVQLYWQDKKIGNRSISRETSYRYCGMYAIYPLVCVNGASISCCALNCLSFLWFCILHSHFKLADLKPLEWCFSFLWSIVFKTRLS